MIVTYEYHIWEDWDPGLSAKTWKALEDAGWKITCMQRVGPPTKWVKHQHFVEGGTVTSAEAEFQTLPEALTQWSSVTGLNLSEAAGGHMFFSDEGASVCNKEALCLMYGVPHMTYHELVVKYKNLSSLIDRLAKLV